MVVDWDVVYDMQKARDLGYHKQRDNIEMFISGFAKLRADKVIP